METNLEQTRWYASVLHHGMLLGVSAAVDHRIVDGVRIVSMRGPRVEMSVDCIVDSQRVIPESHEFTQSEAR